MSNGTSAKLQVYARDHAACVKIAGRANVASSIDFKRLVNELLEHGTTCFVLDLSDCVLMDSTFLGVLAGFGLKLAEPPRNGSGNRAIELLNPNERIADLLENLGVAQLFKVKHGAAETNGNGQPATEVVTSSHTRAEVTSNCLEAHLILIALDPANSGKFKDVTRFLAEDLERLKAKS